MYRQLACLTLLFCCASVAGAEQWPVDEIGFPYRWVYEQGMVRRDYFNPIRQAVAWEALEHFQAAGLADTRTKLPRVGFDDHGRTWLRDDLGYAYHVDWSCGREVHHYYEPTRQAYATLTRTVFSNVDLEKAVRQGVRNGVVRGFNATTAIRNGIRDTVVHGMNAAKAAHADQHRFRSLVAGGVEDAVVEAFNRVAIESGMAPPDTEPKQKKKNELPKPTSPEQLDSAALRLDSYSKAQVVPCGWLIGPAGVAPLAPGQYTIAFLQDDAGLVDVYRGDRLIAKRQHFRAAFEDAQELASTLRQGRD